MKALKIIIVTLVLIVILFLVSAWRIGLLSKINIVEAEVGPYYLIYQHQTGHYQKIYRVIDSLNTVIKQEYGLMPESFFGFYHNDARLVKPDSLHWLGGILVTTRPDSLSSSLKIATFNRTLALVAELGTRLKSKTAYLIGPFRVCDALKSYAREHHFQETPSELGHGFIEIYQPAPCHKIIYILPVIRDAEGKE